jgi:hypothetical protein
LYLRAGKLDTASRASAQLTEASAGLTPHPRLHGASQQILLATLSGRWDEVQAQTADAERAVDANLATPCPLNVCTLLNCAAASALAGEEDEAHRLETKAYEIAMEGYRDWFDPPKIRLALGVPARRPRATCVPRVGLAGAAVGLPGRPRRAGHRTSKQRHLWLQAGHVRRAIALRALGIARGVGRPRQALERFRQCSLWHADQTRPPL